MATKTPDTEPRISWWEYQKRNKWFMWAAFCEALAIACAVKGDDYGGWWAFAGFNIPALILVIYGGVYKWLEYKRGDNS